MTVPGCALAISPQRRAVIAFARIGKHRFRLHRDAGAQCRPTASSMACMIAGTPAMTMTLAI